MFCIFGYLLRRRMLSGGDRARKQNTWLCFLKFDKLTDEPDQENMGKHDLSVFTYESVLAATSNFSEENKLGEGGFGPVYKGKLVTGREIAVKRLSKSSGQGNSEFKNELILIHELQHTNLVQLFGFCIHEDERMLIYEYMPNKSLDYFIFDSIRGMLLDWKKRFGIIEGITQGLLYLHRYSRTRVIHRDLKASNILLDENMNPKIADFGLARIFIHTELEANTSRIVGTLGYMPPETIEGIVSVKTDVYSFGVLILEIISGRKNNRFCNDDGLLNLVGYAWELWKENKELELMDPTLGDSCNGNQLLRCIHVGLLCVDENAADRPTMSDVISMLTNESMELPKPKKPAYYAQGNVDFTGIRETGEQTGSINVLSNSDIVSASGKFNLSFVVQTMDSNTSYIAILRNNQLPNKAWIGNRNSPIPYPSSPLLTFDLSNTLRITYQGGNPIVIYSPPKNISSTNAFEAILLDSGNFVIREASSVNGSTNGVLWQSFDYPTDTFLPGMKLGVDRRSGKNWSLLSWATSFNPAPGPLTLDWDPNGKQLRIKQGGVVYWTSGVFDGGKFPFIFPEVSEQRYNFSIISNEYEDYLTYSSVGDPSDPEPEWVLYSRGTLFEYGAQVAITNAQYCDGYNAVGGCVRRDRPSNCTGKFGDEFVQKNGYLKIKDSSNTSRATSWHVVSSVDCKVLCWQNCSCLGFDTPADNQSSGPGCRFWSVDCEFVENRTGSGNTSSVFVLSSLTTLANSPPAKKNVNSGRKWLWVVIAIPTALLLTMFCIFGYLLRRRMLSGGDRAGKQNTWLFFDEPHQENMGKHDLSIFTYESILTATSNFSEENKLGEGGFGPVYKGKLETGREIAVKRLSKSSGQGNMGFKNELILIHELQHTNLVQLFGFCSHEDERMLIYEYMPNKSLDYFIFDSIRGRLLDWKKRFGIIEGITQGLLYLHRYSRTRVIHRDLKASNILLDENMNPKIADFGLASIFTHTELEANTSRIVGTLGYMPPETIEGIVSVKTDVYSFGVLILEIISGRKNNRFCNDDGLLNLVGYAWELWKENKELELMDPTLGDSYNGNQLLRCIHVGLLCVDENAADRPTMSDVISMLTNESMELPKPKKPAYYAQGNVDFTGIRETGEQTGSINVLSHSDIGGR
nr:G-type lectin S-receptor-like serine/threonine-protein kinase CES101 [Malus domestica]